MLKQEVLDLATPLIQRDLLKPIGLVFPRVPIRVNDDPMWYFGGTFGGSRRRSASDPTFVEINIQAQLNDHPEQAVCTLAHEMLHTSLPFSDPKVRGKDGSGHGEVFAKYAKEIGMATPYEWANPAPKFHDWYLHEVEPILRKADLIQSLSEDGMYRILIGRKVAAKYGHDYLVGIDL